jgi:hypothetical protein
MDFNFGLFGKYLIYTFYFWYITMPIAFLLLWACLRKKNSLRVRWSSGIGAMVLLFPMAVLLWEILIGLIEDGINRREFEQQKKLHTYSLKRSETTAGIVLSAGDTVYYAISFDMNNRKQAQLEDIDSVRLSKPTRFFNLQVKGVIGVNQYGDWNVHLTHQQGVFGWPCTGNVMIGPDSTFVRGTLAEDYVVLGYRLPKGSEVRYREDDLINIILPNSEWLSINPKTKQPISGRYKKLADSLRYKRP